MLQTITTLDGLRLAIAPWLRHNETIGFIPTMGVLHEGQMELVRQSNRLASHSIVCLLVNTAHAAELSNEKGYPPSVVEDQSKLETLGCDILFMPNADELYPEGFATQVDPGRLGKILEGAKSPGFFSGVATVMTRLLMFTLPDYVFFGEKDHQQLQIMKQIIRDLSISTEVVSVPTVREEDGLAMASRNAWLTAEEREKASVLPRVLFDCVRRIRDGGEPLSVLSQGKRALVEGGFKVDYLTLVNGDTLESIDVLQKNARILVAAVIGSTRLLDNMAIFGSAEQDLLLLQHLL